MEIMPLEIILRVIAGIFASYGALYLGFALCHPSTFLDFFSINEAGERKRLRHESKRREEGLRNVSEFWGERAGIRIWAKFALTFLSLGLVLYHAAFAIFQFVPADWGNVDHEGVWQQTRAGLQITFALISTLLIMDSVEKRVASNVRRSVEAALLKPIENALRYYSDERTHLMAMTGLEEASSQLMDAAKSGFERREIEATKGMALSQLEHSIKGIGRRL